LFQSVFISYCRQLNELGRMIKTGLRDLGVINFSEIINSRP